MSVRSSPPVPTGVFLVVDDDAGVTRALARELSLTRPCVTAGSVAAARERMATSPSPFSGFVFDLLLPDGSGLELLREARRIARDAPALILTGRVDREVVNGAYALGGVCLLKPVGYGELARFAAEAAAAELGIDTVTRARVAQVVAERNVTPPELEILVAKVAGLTAEELIARRGISRNTYKTQVRALLDRLGVESLEEARRWLLQRALE